MRKHKSKLLDSLLHSTSFTAVGIVLLMISVGAVALPMSLAATSYPAPKSSLTVTNAGTYSVRFAWSGTTPSQWEYTYGYANGVAVGGHHFVAKNVTSVSLSGLNCGKNYGYRVYAADASGNYVSPHATDIYHTLACPAAALTGLTASGNTVNAQWSDTAGFDTGYTLYLRAGSGSYVAHTTNARSLAVGGSCATTYTAYVTASASGQTGASSATRSVTTAACPVPVAPAPAPAAVPKPTAPKKTPVKTTPTPAAVATPTAPATPAPATPANFAADVQSQKIVDLSWDAVTSNIDHYVINRSTDNVNWAQLATTKATTYQDNADFATTYYYQLQAVGGDGQTSGLATAQATTDSFSSSSNTITSDDKYVSVVLPSGAIDGDYNCTLSTDQSSLVNIPLKQHVLAGPYDLLCVDDNGALISKFKKPVAVTIKTAAVASGYSNLTARTSSNQSWDVVKSTYNAKTKQLSFTLTSAKTFSAFGQKKHSYAGLIISIFLLLLLIAAAVVGLLWWRRRQPSSAVAAVAAVQERTAEEEFRHALAAPDCTHKDMAQPVTPSSAGCYECQRDGTHWKALRICLICGHVGCSDDSDQQHALKHYQETGHPIVYDYADPAGNSIGWCYIDKTYI